MSLATYKETHKRFTTTLEVSRPVLSVSFHKEMNKLITGNKKTLVNFGCNLSIVIGDGQCLEPAPAQSCDRRATANTTYCRLVFFIHTARNNSSLAFFTS